MAIAFVKDGVAGARTTSGTSLVLTVPAGGHAAGNTLVMAVAYVTSISDTRGNTWASVSTGIYASKLTTALQAGDSITINHPPSGIIAGTYAEFSGLSTTRDGSEATTGVQTGTAMTAGSVTASVAGELVLGVFNCQSGGTDTTVTAGSGYAMAPHVTIDTAYRPQLAWQIGATATAYTPNATRGVSGNWTSTSAILSGSVPINTVAPAISGTRVVGHTLSCTQGTWTNTPSSYAYQWKSNGADISGATSSTFLLTNSEGGMTATCAVTATNANGASTPAVSNGLFIEAAMVTNDVQWLQGGLGGAPGAAIVDPRSVFDDVLNAEAVAGDVEYRLVYLKNAHTVQTLGAPVTWIDTQTSSATTDLAIGIATEAASVNVAAIANEQTAPAGVTFAAPATSGAGLSVGDLTPGQFRGVWLRWTVNAGTAATGTDATTAAWQGTPA